MKKNLSGIVCCMLVAMVLLNSCSKEGPAGATGATGASGAAGTPGAAGPAGPAGPAGTTGTANVIYSDWLDVKYVWDTVHTGAVIDTVGIHADITATKLTVDILTKGEIKVYWNRGTVAAPVVVPLPFDLDAFLTPVYSTQRIRIIADGDYSTFTSASTGKTFQYRYILIPGMVTARSMSNPATAINWNNYNEVKAYLNLKD